MKKFVFGLAVLGAMAAAGAAFGALQGGGVEGDPYLIGSYPTRSSKSSPGW